ncbi:B-box type zinc finger family protein [Perilla frutescens var. hirtella]|nr:B-box type zinc finger family protein [Perilla frutescens var. hirtella]
MSRKGCELCSNPARMFCDSDQASLCWDCDEKVHAANFLVAKHSRTLLCHVCHSPTPWKAAGPKLGPTVSVCHACARQGGDEESDGDRDEDGEGVSLSSSKRSRDDASASEEVNSFDAGMGNVEFDENYASLRFLRRRGSGGGGALIPPSSGTAAIVEKLRRFEQEESEASAMIVDICNLTRD